MIIRSLRVLSATPGALGLLFILCATAVAAADRAQQPSPVAVFRAAPVSPDIANRAASDDAAVLRSRVVAIDPAFGAAFDAARDGGLSSMRLDLFDDAIVTATLTRVDDIITGPVWVGRTVGDELGTVTLASRGGAVVASVMSRQGNYLIRPAGDGLHLVQQVDLSRALQDDAVAVPEHAATPGRVMLDPVVAADDGSTIDVLVVYTAAAVTTHGGVDGLNAAIGVAVSQTNTAFANSGINPRVRLVHTELVPYAETGGDLTTDLYALSGGTGGLSGVAAIRDAYQADFVSLVVGANITVAAGRGYLSSGPTNNSDWAFTVVQAAYLAGAVQAHEWGHNAGIHHDWYQDGVQVYYSYGHGYVDVVGRWIDVMAYSSLCSALSISCSQLLYFSNPDLTAPAPYPARPMGVPAGTSTACTTGNINNPPCDSDGRQVWNRNALALANYRSATPVGPVITAQPRSATVVAGRSFTFQTLAVASPKPSIQVQRSTNGGSTWTNVFSPSVASSYYAWLYPTPADHGNMYRAVMTSSNGTAVTDVASLSVVAPYDFNADRSGDLVWRNPQTGQLALWYMSASSYSGFSWLPTVNDPAWRPRAAADFNRDGKPDLVWRNTTTGENIIWYLNGASYAGYQRLPSVSDAAWSIQGAGYYNDDEKMDLVWWNSTTGEAIVWLLDDGIYQGYVRLPTQADTHWVLAGVGDFNRNLVADIFWHNTATGENRIWNMNANGSIFQTWTLITQTDPNAYVLGVQDIDGDNFPDLLWRNRVTGANTVWYLTDFGQTRTTGTLTALSDVAWTGLLGDAAPPQATASDFNADGKPDILWRNSATGENIVWLLNGSAYVSYSRVDAVSDANWKSVATGDFNADGKPDIFWRNTATGENIVWLMNGTGYTRYERVDSVPIAWRIAAAADFNRDGKVDLLWRNMTTGENIIWFMNGTSYVSYERVLTVADTTWQIAAAADLNSDGKPDILWRNYTTGENIVWLMNGSSYVSYVRIDTITDTNWKLVMAADFNSDGKPDILWRHATTGENIVWILNGAAYVRYERVLTVADPNWKVGPQQY